MSTECKLCGLTINHIHPSGMAREVLIVEDEPANEWTTYDMGLACAMSLLGHPIKRIDRDPMGKSNKRSFVFDDSQDLQESVQKFWNDKIKVKAKSFFDEIRNVKNRLYSDS